MFLFIYLFCCLFFFFFNALYNKRSDYFVQFKSILIKFSFIPEWSDVLAFCTGEFQTTENANSWVWFTRSTHRCVLSVTADQLQPHSHSLANSLYWTLWFSVGHLPLFFSTGRWWHLQISFNFPSYQGDKWSWKALREMTSQELPERDSFCPLK